MDYDKVFWIIFEKSTLIRKIEIISSNLSKNIILHMIGLILWKCKDLRERKIWFLQKYFYVYVYLNAGFNIKRNNAKWNVKWKLIWTSLETRKLLRRSAAISYSLEFLSNITH